MRPESYGLSTVDLSLFFQFKRDQIFLSDNRLSNKFTFYTLKQIYYFN